MSFDNNSFDTNSFWTESWLFEIIVAGWREIVRFTVQISRTFRTDVER